MLLISLAALADSSAAVFCCVTWSIGWRPTVICTTPLSLFVTGNDNSYRVEVLTFISGERPTHSSATFRRVTASIYRESVKM